MSILMTQKCLSAEPWFEVKVPSSSDPELVYTVLVPFPDDAASELCCECESFVYRGRCKHQDIAFATLCQWTAQLGPEQQSEQQRRDNICPRCSGPTVRTAEWD